MILPYIVDINEQRDTLYRSLENGPNSPLSHDPMVMNDLIFVTESNFVYSCLFAHCQATACHENTSNLITSNKTMLYLGEQLGACTTQMKLFMRMGVFSPIINPPPLSVSTA